MKEKSNKLITIFPIFSGIFFGSGGIFIRRLIEMGIDSYSIVFLRVFIALPILILWLFFTDKKLFYIKLKDTWIFFGAGVLGTLGLNLSYNYSITELSLSLSAILLSLAPIFVVIFSFFLFKEKITSIKIWCMILAIVGSILASGVFEDMTTMHWSFKGIVVGLFAAIFYSLYSIFSKIAMEKKYDALTITLYSTLAITIVLFPLNDWKYVKEILSINPLNMSIFMILHSLCTCIFPYALYTIALNHMDAGKASILCSCEPIAATIFGLLFYNEVPTLLSLVGLVIVLIALGVLSLKKNSK
ncbi:DMT family transporter [uncultured Fusobacterium sp.]|uniref:DMT family transporter n=1 Tax=uncultured Fusobacterium sp. TaxID=159267 RepID=UPI0025D5A55F|nr:DMT family transporter [uncultured Fusobacterium sp.]